MPVSATLIFNARFFSFGQLAVFFAVVWGGSAVVFLFSDQFGIPFYSHPLALACFFLLFFINTLNVCFRHCRFWLLKALVSTVKFVFVFYFARARFHASRLILTVRTSQTHRARKPKKTNEPRDQTPAWFDNQTPARSDETKEKPSVTGSNTELIPSFQD